ncbi:MAG: flagellar biosynthetic protein FliQ [Rhodospirillales bacterium 12-54-5]|nr:MAG: flagellar biosynthetic protein FliQ [Rhodospirillales bacterium 12-54-5]
MEANDIIQITRDGVKVLMVVAAPMMITAMVVGVALSILQALTQIQETTLTLVPKVSAMLLVLIMTLPFMVQTLKDYTDELFTHIINIE